MRALILNSGTGSRMGDISKTQPKCLTRLTGEETILSRQLRLIEKCGITQVVITTGKFDQIIREYCMSVAPNLQYVFIQNPHYDKTNYIYSIWLAKEYLSDDLVLMHGDLVFEEEILRGMISNARSCMAICASQPLPDKDFKAVLKYPKEEQQIENPIYQVGINCFENACAAQPLYFLDHETWGIWLSEIERFCEDGQTGCYAENAFNEVSGQCLIYPYETGTKICGEIDTMDDLNIMRKRLDKK